MDEILTTANGNIILPATFSAECNEGFESTMRFFQNDNKEGYVELVAYHGISRIYREQCVFVALVKKYSLPEPSEMYSLIVGLGKAFISAESIELLKGRRIELSYMTTEGGYSTALIAYQATF